MRSILVTRRATDIPEDALASVEIDLQAFSERVDDYLYGIALT